MDRRLSGTRVGAVRDPPLPVEEVAPETFTTLRVCHGERNEGSAVSIREGVMQILRLD